MKRRETAQRQGRSRCARFICGAAAAALLVSGVPLAAHSTDSSFVPRALDLTLERFRPLTAHAAVTGPSQPSERGMSLAELNGYSEERWAALMDNTLSYDEIDDLIHSFNPVVVSAWSNLNDNLKLIASIRDNIKSREREMKNEEDEAKRENRGDASIYAMQSAILKSAAHGMNETVEKMSRAETSTNRPLRQAERQVSGGAKQLMIAYDGLREQIEILRESEAMYQKLLADAEARLAVGMATPADVQQARVTLLSTQSQLGSLETTAESLRKNLILLCGWKEDAQPEITRVPDADVTRIDRMDPETDLKQAIAKNASIIAFHHERHDKSSESMRVRDLTEGQMYDNLLVNLRTQKEKAIADRAALEGAKAGMQAAEMTKNAADLQYQMGMISTAQYLGAVTQYAQARTALLTADSTLFLDLEQYDWMLSGTASVE